jgi:predicted transcriptional regulator of viral defense system
MSAIQLSQRELLRTMIGERPMLRARELRDAGIAGTTIARALHDGDIDRVGRGLYQRPDSEIDTAHALAETAKRIPKGVIAMLSALAYHGLTDQMPRKVWVAIGQSEWLPVAAYPPTRIVRFDDRYLTQGVEHHAISVAKTLADLFRNARLVDRAVAVEGLRAALDQRKATPGAIADAAKTGGAWNIMRPYLEALTSNG